MDQRDSFVFYRSFFEAVSELSKKDQTAVLLAICEYALNGTEPKITGIPAAIFILIKPNLDANQKKYQNGKIGGRPKTKPKPNHNLNETKAKAKDNLNITETEPNEDEDEDVDVNVDVDVNEDGDEDGKRAISAVMTLYLDRVNASPSQTSLDELKGYTRRLGAEICVRAINAALDAGKASWSYIRAILSAKERQGVRSGADWDRLEAEYKKQHSSAGGNVFLDMLGEGQP